MTFVSRKSLNLFQINVGLSTKVNHDEKRRIVFEEARDVPFVRRSTEHV
jgi:hypothetical protein